MTTLYEPVHGLAPPIPDKHAPENQQSAMALRPLRSIPEAQYVHLESIIINGYEIEDYYGPPETFIRELIITSDLESHHIINDTPLDFSTPEEVIDSRPYPTHRKQQLHEAGILVAWQVANTRYWRNESFIKGEAYPEIKAPRSINARDDGYKASTIHYWQAANDRLFHYLDPVRGGFPKHLCPQDQYAYVEQITARYPMIYTADISRFESICTKPIMLACETTLYKRMGIPEEVYMPLIENQVLKMRHAKGYLNGDTARMSGDMATSLGNSFTNWCIFRTVCRMHGVNVAGVVEGDDAIWGADAEIDADWFLPYGIRIELTQHVTPGHGGYCSRYVSSTGVYLLSPWRILKHPWSVSAPVHCNEGLLSELWQAKNLSLAYECPSSPIAWALIKRFAGTGRIRTDLHKVERLQTLGVPHRVEGCWTYLTGKVPTSEKPTSTVRHEYAQLFDLSPQAQVRIEDDILAGNLNNAELYFWLAQKFPDAITTWHFFTQSINAPSNHKHPTSHRKI